MKIQTALAANAVFSGGSALLIALYSPWLGAHIPMPEGLWVIASVGLGLFSVQLLAMVMNERLAQLLIKSVILADAMWLVLVSIALLVFQDSLSGTGIRVVVWVNIVVGSLAWWQFKAWSESQALSNLSAQLTKGSN